MFFFYLLFLHARANGTKQFSQRQLYYAACNLCNLLTSPSVITSIAGMPNRQVIEYIEQGNRMPKPQGVECPDSVFQCMMHCWDAEPEKRPTFEYLFNFFDDYFVSTEPSYRDAEEF